MLKKYSVSPYGFRAFILLVGYPLIATQPGWLQFGCYTAAIRYSFLYHNHGFCVTVGIHSRFPRPEPLKNVFLMVAVPKEVQTNRGIRGSSRKDQRSRYNHLSWKTVDDWQAVDICCSFFSLLFWIIGHKTPCSCTLAVSEREREAKKKPTWLTLNFIFTIK